MADWNPHSSDEQQKAERVIFDKLRSILGIDELKPNMRLALRQAPSTHIEPDFYSEEQAVIGEIYAHMGKLKPSQGDKVASDMLKMLLYERDCGRALDKYIVVCSEDVEKQLLGSSILSAARRQFGFRVIRVEIGKDRESWLLEAQKRQGAM